MGEINIMVTNMKFGECLRCLLSILDISIVKLSKAINVDNSLVNRWANEKRTPSYNTNYIENISEYLTNCILNSFQEQHLNELFLKVCGDNKIEMTMKEKIKKILLQSQGYSIECKKKALKEGKAQSIGKKDVPKHLDNYEPYCGQRDYINNAIPSRKHNPNFLVNLSSEDKIILGYKNILSASISVLQDAVKHRCTDNVIYISFNSDRYISSQYDSDLIYFRSAVLKAINSGWNILFLLILSNNVKGITKIMNFIQPLITTGRFNPCYFKKYDFFTTNKEFIIVPEIGALLNLSSNLHSESDTAFYFRNKVAVDILKNDLITTLAANAESLFKYYRTDNAIEFSNLLIEQEDCVGNRFLYKYDFSTLILSESLYMKLLQKKNLTHDEMLTSLKFYKKRLKSFLSNIHYYKHWDIYSIDCISNLIKYRKLFIYCHNRVETVDLEVQDIIQLFKSIITLLEKYDNYNIAFMSQNCYNATENYSFWCTVKERKAVLLEAYEHSKNVPKVRLSIEEPLTVKAFEEHFYEILGQIAPINKDKNEVISLLQRQIDLLKNHN